MSSTTNNQSYLPAVSDEVIAALDTAASNKSLTVKSQFQRAFATATAIGQLKALLTPEVMKPIMNLQNSPLGFMTDRKDGYPLDVVRDCVIDAVLSGVSPVGNEFNIIASRAYVTKNGMKHKLRDVPELNSFSPTPGIPKMMGDKGAVIDFTLDWNHAGKQGHQTLTIPVRVNAGMGADAIIGKATRKAYAWLFEHITGQAVNEGDATDNAAPVIEAKVSAIDTAPATEPAASETGDLPM